MELGAAVHFSQGWPYEIVEPAKAIGLGIVRDTIRWSVVETAPGTYDFAGTAIDYPRLLALNGIELRPVFGWGNPLYDAGATPHTAEGRAAFAEFVAMVLRRNPLINTIEIGNEFNAQNFVAGPVAESPYAERAGHYARLLAAVHDRVRPEFPNVAILGGALHSIPVAYARTLLAEGAFRDMDGLAFHPYTSPPELVGLHLELLHATEFGGEFETFEEAAPYLVRMVAALAAAGVSSAIWYSLREQPWYTRMELLDLEGAPRPAGESFAFAQEALLPHAPVERLPTDPLTHLYSFGGRALVAWGLPRPIAVDADVVWFDSRGRPIASPAALDPDEPVIALADAPIDFAAATVLGEQATITDSFFAFDPRLDAEGAAGAWSYHAVRSDGTREPLSLMEGGERQGEGWRPYVGDPWRRPLSVSESGLRPVDFSTHENPGLGYAVLERFMMPESATVSLCGNWRVRADSGDGVHLTITAGGRQLFAGVVAGEIDLRFDALALEAGDALEFLVGSNADPEADWTGRHVRVVQAAQADAVCAGLGD
jgi:hypothetical protein